jgi:amino acid adenylation domain-containing protein
MSSSNLKFLDDKLEKEKNYWLHKLSGNLVPAGLPLDFKRPKGFISEKNSLSFEIDRETQDRLFKLCGAGEELVFTVLLTALKVYLYKSTGIEDGIVCTTIHEHHGELSSLNKALALRDRVRGRMTIKELLLEVKQTLTEAYTHQKYPFDRILDLLGVKVPKNQAPLFSVAAILENINKKENLKYLKNDLIFVFSICNGSLRSAVEYNPSLFESGTIELLSRQYMMILRAAVEMPDRKISDVALQSIEQQHESLYGFNATSADYPQHQTIHRLFEEQVDKTPDQTAVLFGERSLSYRQLNGRANQVAHHLRSLGVETGARVGVLLDHSLKMVVALLGVLKAGAAYVPLDPEHPRQRLAFMLHDAEVPVLLTEQRLMDAVAVPNVRVICLDTEWDAFGQHSEENLSESVGPQDLAYLIYTSGSTGEPKGVKIQHRSLVNYICWAREVYLRGESLSCALYSSLAFDLTVTSIYLPLISGNRIIIYARRNQQSPLAEILKDNRVGVLKLTPSHLSLVKEPDNGPSRIKRLIVGGEQFEGKLAAEIRNSFGDGIEIYNEYGPTEATVGCMSYQYHAEDEQAFVAIGRPAANTQIYLLDENLQPVAEHVLGELCIAGDGLAEGYLKQAELTAERFIPNPFSAEAGRRMYRSGDLARRLPSGEIEYVGRRDEQVKYHGYRVELNEIRSALNRHPQIRDSVVMVASELNGNQVMVAYYVAEQAIEAEQLRGFLAESIYEEIIPNTWMRLEALPLTLNGKVNYAALPSLSVIRERSQQGYLAPRTPVEKEVAKIWSEALSLRRVGVHDNFFDLGGHSLLATHVVSRVRAIFKVEVALRSLFEARTVARLSAVIEQSLQEQSGRQVQSIKPAARTNELPLSFAQERLWFMDQFDPGNAAYNIPMAVRLGGSLNISALERSLNEIVRRHEILRTSFDIGAEQKPVQVISAASPLPLSVHDLQDVPATERERETVRATAEEARRPFDLQHGPLLRASLLRLNLTEHILLLTMHHIISDGWSMAILIREVVALYQAFIQERESPLSELSIQYADFALWQREWLQGEMLEEQLAYWREQLAGELPVLDLPIDKRRPRQQSHRGARRTFALAADLTEKLKHLAQREEVTLFMTLLAGFQTLLYRYSGQEDIVVGSPIANRHRAEIEELIGFFVNTLVLRARLNEGLSFRELLQQVREVTLGAYAHQDVPFEKLVEELQPARSLSHTPLFQVMFIFQNTPVAPLQLSSLSLEPIASYGGRVKFDLVLNMQETDQGLKGSVEYSTDLFDAETIERMIRHFQSVLQGVTINPDQRLAHLPLLRDSEPEQLLEEWNAVDLERQPACIHRMFEAQTRTSPEACAIISQGEHFSYRELNAQANQVAHGLLSLGIEKLQPVAIMLDSPARQVMTLLGVLKAGYHFVCLDSDHPSSRLQQIIGEVAPGCLISESTCVAKQTSVFHELDQESNCRLVLLDAAAGKREGLEQFINSQSWFVNDAAKVNPGVEISPQDLAYIVYTSGSTGKPKGITQTHDSLVQFIEWMIGQFKIGPGKRIAQWASITYDASYAEIFSALCGGAALCLATPMTKGDPQEVLQWLKRDNISLFQTVPSFCSQLLRIIGPENLNQEQRPLPDLELMLLAGEALPVSLARSWLDHFKQASLYNLYGPTESILATCHRVAEVDTDRHSVSIGRAIAGRQILILDQAQRLCPVGVRGEIYIRSPYLTAGYFRNQDETQQKFFQNPLHDECPDRVYRTGDLGRWLPSGNIEFFGRLDQQVKLRGIRVELEEIEAVLSRHESVRECAVIVHDYDEGDARLVAYVAASDELTGSGLREFLAASLPGYMIPSSFIFLERLPRTPSGKVKHEELPGPDARFDVADYVAPRTPLESDIAEVWQDLLQVERVGINDDFFHLGGHSLLATQVVNKLRQMYGVNLSLREFIESPTITSMAGNIETTRPPPDQPAAAIAAVLERVKSLSDEEVKALLSQQHSSLEHQDMS